MRRSVNVKHIKMHYFTSHVPLNTCAILITLIRTLPVDTRTAVCYAHPQPCTPNQPNEPTATHHLKNRYGIIPGHDGPDLLADSGREHLAKK